MVNGDHLRGYAPPALALIVGVVVSIIAHYTVREHNSSQADVAFASQASNHANIIANGFSQAFFAIESVGALYDSLGSVSSHQFVDFVTPLLERFPTISALGWAPIVHGDEREEFERTARDLFPGYRITDRRGQNEIVGAVERQTYFPVYYISPYVGNEVARGFDLYSNQVRRAAIDRARDSGQTISTGRISLVQETANQYSLLLINPVFMDDSFDERNSRFLGVASAVFRIEDGVERSLSQVQPAGLNIWLFDRSSERDKQFLYFHPSRKLEAKERKMETVPPANASHYVHGFNLGGRRFELILSPASGYFDTDENLLAWLSLITGFGFTGLITAYLELMRRRAQELITGKQALEQQIDERKYAEQQLREANRTLEILSRKDPLMGIANRRYFDEYFQQEWRRAARHGTSLSLLFGDVDYFKLYNDTYGHVAGDKCLQILARVLMDTLDRPGDLAARYGGEEIAIVLPTTAGTGAHSLAEEIRLAVAALALPHEQSPVAKVVTMSIGCGTALPTQRNSMEAFLEAVDAALYRAKQQGRNQTVVETFDSDHVTDR